MSAAAFGRSLADAMWVRPRRFRCVQQPENHRSRGSRTAGAQILAPCGPKQPLSVKSSFSHGCFPNTPCSSKPSSSTSRRQNGWGWLMSSTRPSRCACGEAVSIPRRAGGTWPRLRRSFVAQEVGDFENWLKTIEWDMQTIATALDGASARIQEKQSGAAAAVAPSAAGTAVPPLQQQQPGSGAVRGGRR